MKLIKTEIPEVVILQPVVYRDERGFLLESFNREVVEAIGCAEPFVQDNHSQSKRNVLRGLHYQSQPKVQGKLVRVVTGEIFDVAVDLRQSSPTFRRWVSARLSAENKSMMWIPTGFAHGFLVLSDTADCLYKTTAYYSPEHECTVRWNDPELAIAWPLKGQPVVSEKDAAGSSLRDAVLFD